MHPAPGNSDPLPLLSEAAAGRLGLLICGHGSRNRLAVAEFAELAGALRQRMLPLPLEYGYLEFAQPILRDGLEALRAQGVQHILAVPAMLFAAGHAKNDIPSVLNTWAAETGIRVDYGRELGVDLKMIQAAGQRLREAIERDDQQALASGQPPIPLHDTLLVVVGRGSSDPDANSNVAKVTRMLVEGFGFGWGETVYSGVTFPLVEPGLRHAVKLGFRRLLVFPYFLFSGVLVSRIRQHTERVAADHPELCFVQAGYLAQASGVLDTFVERVEEIIRGDTNMNCSLCKYRAQVLGFETEVGAPQHSHHHHVEGLPESCKLCEKECTGACQPDGLPLPLAAAAPDSKGGIGDPHSDHEGKHHHQGQHHQEGHHDPSSHHDPNSHHEHAGHQDHDGHQDHEGHHHHPIYPHADHPLGPRTLRNGNG
jgi:sirohydrochlorin cobaltochelatase